MYNFFFELTINGQQTHVLQFSFFYQPSQDNSKNATIYSSLHPNSMAHKIPKLYLACRTNMTFFFAFLEFEMEKEDYNSVFNCKCDSSSMLFLSSSIGVNRIFLPACCSGESGTISSLVIQTSLPKYIPFSASSES